MKVIVCIKQVPDTKGGVVFNPDGTLNRGAMLAIMNPDDKAGLEAALRLKDQFGAEVTVLTMGLPKAKDMLIEALAMGADKAVLVTDRKLGGADTWATSSTIAAAIRKLEYDIIITGRQAIDGDTAQVGPQIAEHLGLPVISYTQELKIEDGYAIIKRQYDDRYHMIKAKLPCLCTALAELNDPRYQTVGRIFDYCDKIEADDKDTITTFSRADLDTLRDEDCGLAGSPTKIAKASDKVRKGAGTKVQFDTPEESVAYLMEQLTTKHVI